MKLTPRFIVRASLVLSAAGAVGAFGACSSKDKPTEIPPTSPPPASAPAAPTNVTATAASVSAINVAWTDASTNEDGFKIESCSGVGCTNFAEVGSVAANIGTFAHSGLTANTEYSYRVMAFNTVGNSAASTTAKASTGTIVPAKAGVLVGAGEITSCLSTMSGETAKLIDGVVAENPDAIVYTVGDNLADSSASGTFASCFDPKWGRFKERMRPAIGLRDYDKGPNQVFEYFGTKVGDAGKGWYSYNVGNDWHVIVLNTSTWQWGSTMMADPNSEMNQWLAKDLLDNAGKKCTMAIFNLRRFYSYGTMENANVKPIWKLLHAGGADVVLSAYDNYYERWAPQNHDMQRDDAAGIRQFIVGTGGRTLSNYATLKPIDQVPNLEVRNNTTWGVLKFTLNSTGYDWEFIPTNAGGFTDKGTAACH